MKLKEGFSGPVSLTDYRYEGWETCGHLLPSDYAYCKRGEWKLYCESCATEEEILNCKKCGYPLNPKRFTSHKSGYCMACQPRVASPEPCDIPLKKEPEKGGKFMSIVKKVKNLAKSKDQRLLEKHYVVDNCGNLTSDGKEVVLAKVFETVKADIVADLQKIDAEEKPKK